MTAIGSASTRRRGTITVQLSDQEWTQRAKDLPAREPRTLPPTLAKYAQMVGPAAQGAVTY
jgi:dihydroxyacid dehydratase/phosphogluconate dehydratase